MTAMLGYTFSPAMRLHGSSEFQRVYRHGKRLTTEYFVLFFKGGECGSKKRLGITVTREVGKAHHRNRIKRQARELFRAYWQKLPPGDFVVKARMGASQVESSRLREDLEVGYQRLLGRDGKFT